MSDANTSALGYIRESAWGTTPATPSLRKSRMTGEGLVHEKDTVESEEIRDDRMVPDLVEVGSQASGSVNFELSYEASKEFFEAALFASIQTINITETVDLVAGVAASGTYTLSGNVADGYTVEIGGYVYTFRATPAQPFDVDVAGSASASIDNLIAAIINGAGAGSAYAAGTPPHPSVIAAAGGGDSMDVTARQTGTAGNSITTTATGANASFGAATLAGGVDSQAQGTAGDFSSINAGTTVKVAGSATAGNNGLKLVTAVSTDGADLTFASGSFVADTSTESITLTGKTLRNGKTRHSYTIERRIENTAGTPLYQIYRGMMVDGMELTFESKAIVTGSMTFLGKRGEDGGSISLDADQAYTDAYEGDVVNATSHIGSFLVDREATSERFKSLNLTIANNLRGKDAMGELGNYDVGVGSFNVSGNLMAYFQDRRLHQKFIAHSNAALSFRVTDPDGSVMVFTIPRVKLSSGSPEISAKDTDVMVAADFTAIRDATTNAMLIIDFHDAA